MQKSFSLPIALAAVAVAGIGFCSSAEAQWGTLKGQILLDGDLPKLKPLVVQGDPTARDSAICAAEEVPNEKLVVDPTGRGIANVFVYIQKKPAKIHPDLEKSAVAEVKFDQKGCRFIPHAMFVRTDQKVRVFSGDDTAHNTHSTPLKNDPDNFNVPANERTGILMKPLKLTERVPVTVICDIHSWMGARLAGPGPSLMARSDRRKGELRNCEPAGRRAQIHFLP